MADPIMSPAPPPAPPRPDPEISTSDLIENNLEQLHSLLCCCHEDDGLVLQGASPEHLDNLLWLAASVVRQTQALFQKVARP
jgi:hypothetical protein